jgi:hypothetical protein
MEIRGSQELQNPYCSFPSKGEGVSPTHSQALDSVLALTSGAASLEQNRWIMTWDVYTTWQDSVLSYAWGKCPTPNKGRCVSARP